MNKKITYQLLISTMNQSDDSICSKMNIQSDAIVINQTNYYGYDEVVKNGNRIKIYSFNERGVGLSRNSALMRSTADIVEFADDDMVFVNNHEELVLEEFSKHPEADAILFSLESCNKERPLIKIENFHKVGRREALKYGCARLAVKREKLLYNNICFSLLFGGGARYGSGEDTLILQDILNRGLRMYISPIKLADVKQDCSTWFNGYTDKYYKDKGALFAALFPKIGKFYALLTALKVGGGIKNFMRIYKLYQSGIKEYNSFK